MKKLVSLIVVFGLLVYAGTAIAQGVEECTIPKGVIFGLVHLIRGPVGVLSGMDNKITVTYIKKNVPNPENPKESRSIANFSLLRDKPVIQNVEGKLFIYEVYKKDIANNFGFVFYDVLKDCHK